MRFAVIREQGDGWDASRAMREQSHWPEHVEYINAAADDGFLVLAGPMGEAGSDADPTASVGQDGVYRALLIVNGSSASEVAARLEEDPWTRSGVLETRAIHRWEVLVGGLAED
jgi:uncharacterized protein YciI